MSANVSNKSANEPAAGAPAVPKRITNAQTVCNEKNEKGKLCNGHLKQLRMAGEASEVHLRGDDVLSKCQTCGTLYMGPPLGHVRDPNKQTRFVEAELTALLQAAGGTLPLIKKNEKGVYVMVESSAEGGAAKPAAPAAKPAPAKTATPAGTAAEVKAVVTAAAPKPAAHKPSAEPNRQLFKRSTYAGVVDTGPVTGETFAQKCERLKKVSAAAKQRAEEGGGTAAPAPPAAASLVIESAVEVAEAAPVVETAATPVVPPTAAAHKPSGQADRTLMKRSTYGDVVDTGPIPGESFEDKVARLAKVSAAAKQRADEGGH
jgi:hypothetical protein